MDTIIQSILAVAPAFTAYYLTALGHGFFEKSGVLNLAIDGVFYLSVAVAYASAVYMGNPYIAILISALTASIFGILVAFIVTKLPISHGAAGLSLMFLGYGLGALIGNPAVFRFREIKMINIEFSINIPRTPLTNVALFTVSLVACLVLLYILKGTKLGAAIRASGEDPHAASVLGIDVLKIRLLAGTIGYALIGIGAAIFELVWLPTWQQMHGMGHGWIAFAISLSSGRHPVLTMLTSTAFATLLTYQYLLQAAYNLSPEIAKMTPFIAAIAAMTIFMVTPLRRKLSPPLSLGKIFFKEERTL